MTIDSLLKSLPDFTQAQLEQIKARAIALLQSKTDSTDAELIEIYDIVSKAARSLKIKLLPFPALRATSFFNHFKGGALVVAVFIEDYIKPKSKIERYRCYYIFTKMLIRRLHDLGIPVGPKTISEHFRTIPEVVDVAFPGYRESGFLPVLIRSRSV